MQNKNFLTNLKTKKRFKVDSIAGEEVLQTRITALRLVVSKPKDRKRYLLFRAPLHRKSFAEVKRIPFRLQFTLNSFYLVQLYHNRFGVKNPIDEFVKILDIIRAPRARREIVYLITAEFIDNMEAVKMMHSLHKKDPKKKPPKKTYKKPKRKYRRLRDM